MDKIGEFTVEEYQFMKDAIAKFGKYTLPAGKSPQDTEMRNTIWSWCTKIRGRDLGNPGCACKHAHKHWIACYDEIYKFIESNG